MALASGHLAAGHCDLPARILRPDVRIIGPLREKWRVNEIASRSAAFHDALSGSIVLVLCASSIRMVQSQDQPRCRDSGPCGRRWKYRIPDNRQPLTLLLERRKIVFSSMEGLKPPPDNST